MAGNFISVKGVDYGQLEMTQAINDMIAEDERFAMEIHRCMASYAFSEWGDVDPEGVEANEAALASGDSQILAKYPTCKGNIYIMTGSDRNTTTVSFCDEAVKTKED